MAKKNGNSHIPLPPAEDASPEELAAYFEKYGLDELEKAGFVRDLKPEEQEEMDLLSAECQARVTGRKNRRTQLNLAMSPEQLERFTRYASGKHIPPSTLAKAWILERLDHETKKANMER
jgi:hypothetical protein